MNGEREESARGVGAEGHLPHRFDLTAPFWVTRLKCIFPLSERGSPPLRFSSAISGQIEMDLRYSVPIRDFLLTVNFPGL